MSDMMDVQPDFPCLFAAASGQHGYVTTAQARACGFKPNLLHFHMQTGRFARVHRGVYRLRDYPSSPREEVVAARLAVGQDRAVVSHESALDLHDLSDVIPDAVHLTVPRTVRHAPVIPGVVVHTTTRELRPRDVVTRDGHRVTSVPRTILDAARSRSHRVYELVTGALAQEAR